MKTLGLKRVAGVVISTSGQDLVDYALMAGFVAVTCGALLPDVALSVSSIFSQIGSVMTTASTQG